MEAYKPEIMAWLKYMPTQVVNEVALTQGWSLQEIPFELRRQVKQEARAVILSALRDSVHRSVALNVFSVRRPYLYPAIPFHFMQRSFLQDERLHFSLLEHTLPRTFVHDVRACWEANGNQGQISDEQFRSIAMNETVEVTFTHACPFCLVARRALSGWKVQGTTSNQPALSQSGRALGGRSKDPPATSLYLPTQSGKEPRKPISLV